MYTLFAARGWGSAIAEAAFAFAGVPYRIDYVAMDTEDASVDRLRAVNPLGQVPTVLMPDGTIMTESAAIILHLADGAPVEAGLAPPASAASRPAFLRWLIFIVSAIYPTFTYGDYPARYVDGDAAQKALTESMIARRQQNWLQVEAAAGAPYFLGTERSAIDIYIWAMTHWRPRAAWFAEHCPKLMAIAQTLDGDHRLTEITAQNWPA
jgi:GST-like protein